MNYYIVFVFIFIVIMIAVTVIEFLRLPISINRAEELFLAEEYAKARDIIKKVLNKKSDYPPARYIKARILMKQSQYILAISEFNSLLTLPEFSKYISELDVHYYLASLYNLTQNYLKEIEEYKVILTFNSDDVKANHRLGYVYFLQKNYKSAKEHLLKSITIDSTLVDVYLPLGVSCFHTSDYQKAEQYLLKVLDLKNENSEARYYLGLIYKMKKDYENAIIMLEKSKEDKSFFVNSLYALGEILFEMEEYGEAIAYLEKGLNNLTENSDDSLSYRYLLAECFELENKIEEAVHHWTKIESENPNFRSTQFKLESYRDVLKNENLMKFFQSSLDELQPYITSIIANLDFHIINTEKISINECQYKAYNIRRSKDLPILILFNRTTREISEGQIIDFQKKISKEKCKSGIYITTSKFSLRAKSSATSKMIELYDDDFVSRSMEKILLKKKI